ncbi:ectomycorrhiza-regulated protein, partial [Mycena leptocephala]
DTLYAFSPTTPAHDSFEPSSPESRHGPVIPPPPTHRQRRSAHTGTRKNLRTHGLIPLDAPTQKRTYVTPSATSRKAVPATILKKRMRSIAAHGEHVDKEELEALSPTASEEEVINSKRKKNTLAARETRKRKREHLEALQEKLQALDGEVTMWRERALIGQEMLRSNGLDFSFDGQ